MPFPAAAATFHRDAKGRRRGEERKRDRVGREGMVGRELWS
jgi:hypothetical protein